MMEEDVVFVGEVQAPVADADAATRAAVMAARSAGRLAWDPVTSCEDCGKRDGSQLKIERSALLATLRREDELRFSDEVQKLYDEFSPGPPPSVTAELQAVALQERAGLCRCYLPLYWRTREMYQNDPEIQAAAVYLRLYDRFRYDGVVREGQTVPDFKIIPGLSAALGPTSFLDRFLKEDRPLVVMAGSQS